MYDLYVNSLLVKLSLNEPKFICLHTVEQFQVLLSKVNSFICTQLNGIKHYYLIIIYQFHINHLFAHS